MGIGPIPPGRRGNTRPGHVAAMAAALLICVATAPAFAQVAHADGSGAGSSGTRVSGTHIGAGTSVSGTRVSGTSVLEAADHAELAAAIPASGVSRIALLGDRVARVIRAPGGLRVEHDAASGDLYLHPPGGEGAAGAAGNWAEPWVLFIGTERGFTYRLSLSASPAGAAQILIRNPAVMDSAPDRAVEESGDRIAALVDLIRAVARREPLAGYAIHAGGTVAGTSVSGTSVPGTRVPGLTVIETWRGPRFSALVFEAGPSASEGAEGAAGLARTIATLPGLGGTGDIRAGDDARLAALWLAAPGTGPSGGRLAVAVRESAPAGDTRAGDARAGDTRTGDAR